LGGPSHPWKTSAGTSGGSAAPLVLLLQGEKARARVLVDLWTLTCINWLCTKPYVRGDARAQPRPSALVPRHSRLVAHALARIHSVSRSVVEERRLADAGFAPHDKRAPLLPVRAESSNPWTTAHSVARPRGSRSASGDIVEPVTSSVSANGGEALCYAPFLQVIAHRRWRRHALSCPPPNARMAWTTAQYSKVRADRQW
jgi:hypothetical protein